MIFSTYQVFGSGSAGVYTYYRAGMTAGEFMEGFERLKAVMVNDGDNGFIGTRSVPDDLAEEVGIQRCMWAEPGRSAPDTLPGYVTLQRRVEWVRLAVKAGMGHLDPNEAAIAACS